MAPPPRNGNAAFGFAQRGQPDLHFDFTLDSFRDQARALPARLRTCANGPLRAAVQGMATHAGWHLRRNLVSRRLLSFPHLLVALWVLVLLWGERWIFATKVHSCDWDHWESWPEGATPHHLIFVADPQIIDPHSYPGRPWPLNPLTIRITDNYLRRSYTQLQKALRPDTVIFLGDLFDGGREWKTRTGDFDDPEWAKDHRPIAEQKLLPTWNKKYGEDYWLKEYGRFGDIFLDPWKLGGPYPGPGQRGRKLISSLPGNHDLGFGAEVKIPARRRFNAYFGETNRVDVIGNHTIVSVDTLSLSAGTSQMREQSSAIYKPVHEFLDQLKMEKRRAVAKELRFWRGEVEEVVFDHKVEDLVHADFTKNLPVYDEHPPDFPSILLSHVPLYREPGTPCGPLREHWPPAKAAKGQSTPVTPDHRNAISVSGGYQYQNVLSEADSVKLVKSVGNVVHAFSGDDHDYCEVVHSDAKDNVREITVKSLSMAMGVPTPGFQMVSLWNPVDAQGRPLAGDGKATMQTHLCLLPKQLSTYSMYAGLGVLSVVVLIARALLLPVLNLQPFALDPVTAQQHAADATLLPVYKEKVEAESACGYGSLSSGSNPNSGRFSTTRDRGASVSNGASAAAARNGGPPPLTRGNGVPGKWGWGDRKEPRIEIRRDVYDGGKLRGGAWAPASRPRWRTTVRSRTALVWREIWTTCWRVVWLVLGFFAYLTWKG